MDNRPEGKSERGIYAAFGLNAWFGGRQSFARVTHLEGAEQPIDLGGADGQEFFSNRSGQRKMMFLEMFQPVGHGGFEQFGTQRFVEPLVQLLFPATFILSQLDCWSRDKIGVLKFPSS